MPLKNYTSTVPASQSQAHIEKCLVKHGAREILKLYDDDHRVIGFKFIVTIDAQKVPFHLPARVKRCEDVLYGETSSRTRPETLKKIPAQAERTAWKIVLDWVEAQMAMIELAQVDFMEVFLPYVWDARNEQTIYQAVHERGYRALLEGGGS